MARWASIALTVESADAAALANPTRIGALGAGIGARLGIDLPSIGMHRFSPRGVSCFRHGPAGRVAIHTWPEDGCATIDVWTSLERLEPACEGLLAWLGRDQGLQVVAHRILVAGGSRSAR